MAQEIQGLPVPQAQRHPSATPRPPATPLPPHPVPSAPAPAPKPQCLDETWKPPLV